MTQYREVDDNELMSLYGAQPSAPQAQQAAQVTQTQLAPVVPPAKTSAPTARTPVAPAQTPAPDMTRMAESVLSTQQQMQQRPPAEAQNPVKEAINYITDNWELFAVPAVSVAANYAVKNLSPSKRSIVDRMFNLNAPQSAITSPMAIDRVDPVVDNMNPVQKMDIDVKRLDPEWQKIIAQSEANRVSKERELELRRQQRQQAAVDRINEVPTSIGNPTPKSPNPIPDVIAATTPITAPLPEVPTVADIGKQAVGVAPVEAPSTTTQIATEATQKKSTGRPKGSVGLKDTPETWQKLTKEGVVFLPGYGPGDNSLYNTYGAEGRKAILEKYNQGKPLGSDENYKELNKKLRLGVPPSEVPGLMARLPSAEEAGNYGKLGKQMKVGGVLGLGLLASQLANAKSNTEAKQVLGEALLPLGLTPSTLQSGTLPPEIVQQMMAERQKLGSPFRSVPPPQ